MEHEHNQLFQILIGYGDDEYTEEIKVISCQGNQIATVMVILFTETRDGFVKILTR